MTETKLPGRAALYLRQSEDVKDGIERQRRPCRQLAEMRGFEVTAEYEDNDVSATKPRGPKTAWGRLIADAHAGKFDLVIAVDLDRLLRSVKDLLSLTDSKIKVVTVNGEIDLMTADGEFRATMLAGIAPFEGRRKGERQIRANADAAAKGRRTGGRRPFGYEQDGVTLRPVEAAAVAVANGFTSFLLGVPLAAIARDWNDQGLFTGQARYSPAHHGSPSPWHAYSVRVVLANPRYKGMRAHLGVEVAKAAWPLIVDEATWQAVNAALANPDRRNASMRGRYLLSGLALCGVCGAQVHAGGNARKGVPAYRCGGSTGHFSRRSAPVKEFVEAVMIARLSGPQASDLITETARPGAEALITEAVGIRERRAELERHYATGTEASLDLLLRSDARMLARLAEIDELLADAGRLELLGPLVGAKDVAAVWAELSTDRKRAIIDDLATVRLHPVGRGVRTFDPATVQITWKGAD